VYADFVADVVAGRDMTLHSDGSARRAFCYLADAVAGFFMVLLAGAVGEAYNVGNNQAETSILDLATLLAGLYPEKGLQVRVDEQCRRAGYLPSAVDRFRPNTQRIEALGWHPVTPLREGFERTIASFT
jgi:nucleoside-diphosphate-sugar epimerase